MLRRVEGRGRGGSGGEEGGEGGVVSVEKIGYEREVENIMDEEMKGQREKEETGREDNRVGGTREVGREGVGEKIKQGDGIGGYGERSTGKGEKVGERRGGEGERMKTGRGEEWK